MHEAQPYYRAYDNGRSLLIGNNFPDHAEKVGDANADDGDWDETVSRALERHCVSGARVELGEANADDGDWDETARHHAPLPHL